MPGTAYVNWYKMNCGVGAKRHGTNKKTKNKKQKVKDKPGAGGACATYKLNRSQTSQVPDRLHRHNDPNSALHDGNDAAPVHENGHTVQLQHTATTVRGSTSKTRRRRCRDRHHN